MKKKQVGTILLIVMTVGLIGAIIYFNVLLNDKSPTAVTQIKKTKASAITYHKLLALNTTPIPDSSSSSTDSTVNSSSSEVSSTTSSVASVVPSALPTNPVPTAAPTLIAFRPASSQAAVIPTIEPTVEPVSSSSLATGYGGGAVAPTAVPTLIAYRPLSPTLIPPADTGGDQGGFVSSTSQSSSRVSPTKVVPTKAVGNELPQTGWVQMSMIFFIVAAATVFVSFLF